ncbi:MAG: hypothetical protein QOF63_1930 [Thermoanaerobaculia bacterium]|nr:hypothetical protein [Thermoanaerobaculia bacterium]
MTFCLSPRLTRLTRLMLVACLLMCVMKPVGAADPEEPIAYIGHGAFFDSKGKQIPVTAQWVEATQEWYRKKLVAALPEQKKSAYAGYHKRLFAEVRGEGQTGLVVRQQELDWLLANAAKVDPRTVGKLNALKYELEWQLPTEPNRETPKRLEKFTLDPAVEQKLRTFAPSGPIVFLSTINTGQAYIDECTANQVPIPPSIGVIDDVNGTAGWKRLGYIPAASQFITNTPAQLRVYHSTSPEGMCVALPRYTDASLTTVKLDGVICLSQVTSKVCIWDNQMAVPPSSGKGKGFNFGVNDVIPIGVPSMPGGQYQGGGREIELGSGGVCTDCHAGENPYIIHPDLNLPATPTGSGGPLMSTIGVFGTDDLEFAPNRYDPIVGASWPQNDKSMTPAYVPSQCLVCHTQGDAGRFPHLSTVYQNGYCNTILAQAIQSTLPHTMPQGAPGTLANDPAVITFTNWCGQSPASGPSDRGDPHLTTTNGIPYDFQGGGEFTALRNSDSRFELQTRQTPITTSFVPGANAYTELQSCVSLNSAAAMRLGKHRVTFQGGVNNERVQLRIDGRAATLPAGGFDLGGGNLITGTSGGGIDVRADDGTHVKITPQHWVQEGYWYLDVEILNTPAREGPMGTILPGNFLPLAPDGSSFGPKPAATAARYDLLNRHFADAWRVTNATSLFDYAPGTSTADFTDRNWPPEPGRECKAKIGILKAPQPMSAERAKKLCSVIKDRAVFENCVFDTIVMGDESAVLAYQRLLKARGTMTFPLSSLP